MNDDEEALIDAARAGDRTALERLIERHQGRVFRFGMNMCRHPEDAEDVLQETLLTVARSIGDFRGGSSFSTWLYTIARSYCIKKRRKSKFAPTHEQSIEQDASREVARLEHPGEAPDDAVTNRELAATLRDAIQRLDSDQREVLLLRDVEGLKASEVAETLGLSVAAVKSRLHRARTRLRELVTPMLEPAPDASCPDVLTLYSERLEGDVSPELCAEMERHLATCARCTATCDSLKATLSSCRRLPTPEVPDEIRRALRVAIAGLSGG